MIRTAALLLLLLAALPAAHARAGAHGRAGLERLNARLHGQVVDYTHNHGSDNRIYSPALCMKRDLYVYLPPGFDPCRQYPFMLWLHAYWPDEQSFLTDGVEPLDRAIHEGKLPPLIVAAPDGSLTSHASLFVTGSFWLNTKAGRYEDYLMVDVWDFLMSHYPILPEREAHIIAGVSMGGHAAFNKAFKYPERFKVVAGMFPPLNLRWLDCHCRYKSPFDPCCWGWRTNFQNFREVLARYFGIITIRQGMLVKPLYGKGNNEQTLAEVSRENPIEMLDTCCVQPGEFYLYVAYGGKDEFNVTAQVDSFLYAARQRGLDITVNFDPNGRHDFKTARKFYPAVLDWLGCQMKPYKALYNDAPGK